MNSKLAQFVPKSALSATRSSSTRPLRFEPQQLGEFTQEAPQLGNPFTSDPLLSRYLKQTLPTALFNDVYKDLERFGERIVGEIEPLGRECDRDLPRLTQSDAWGRRVDRLAVSPAWLAQKRITAEEGLVAIPYDAEGGNQRYGSGLGWVFVVCHASRLYQFAKLLLYAPSAGLYTCPIAMTDGAAKVLQPIDSKKHVFKRLTSRDPETFWSSGQWMTERRGGSDVGGATETRAEASGDGDFRLFGHKWFSSATDADMALTLARTPGRAQHEDSRGLSLFFLETRLGDGSLNAIQLLRLKEKLGTRQVPTAELLLHGTRAEMVSAYS